MLNDAASIREYHDFPTSRPSDTFITRHLKRATAKVKEWVGQAAYDEAASTPPPDPDKAETIKDMEAELFMYYAVVKLNINIGDQGITQSIRSQDGGTIMVASPNQIEKLRSFYFQNAEDFWTQYSSQTFVTAQKTRETETE
jgi:hypothetical protein